LQATTEAESERLLALLISDHAAPIIRETIGYKLGLFAHRAGGGRHDPQAEDIYQDVVVHLLARLNECKASPQESAIGNLRGYVAVATYHACYRHLRRKYPQRHMLKNRLRYLLTHQAGFALWEDEDGDMCAGFAAWRSSQAARGADDLRRLVREGQAVVPPAALTEEARRERPAELLAAIFNYVGGPLRLDELVNAVAELWGITDRPAEVAENEAQIARLPDPRASVEVEAERRTFLQRLWSEILQLPARQRAALLLNLRDAHGRDCIAMFPLTGIASVRQIAAALELPAAQLAELWKHLPLDDASIAARLALTRQQVINLRKSARARLARRMKVFH
jgi:RNA polymerase sigma factor (sigma-70 family)